LSNGRSGIESCVHRFHDSGRHASDLLSRWIVATVRRQESLLRNCPYYENERLDRRSRTTKPNRWADSAMHSRPHAPQSRETWVRAFRDKQPKSRKRPRRDRATTLCQRRSPGAYAKKLAHLAPNCFQISLPYLLRNHHAERRSGGRCPGCSELIELPSRSA